MVDALRVEPCAVRIRELPDERQGRHIGKRTFFTHEKRGFLEPSIEVVQENLEFGAIIRTAECTGVDGIIIQKNGSAPVNAETIKTSAGAAFKVPICKVDHIKDALFLLQASEIKTIAATENPLAMALLKVDNSGSILQ